MTLLTALAIYLGEFPDLKERMKEAVKSIRKEEIRSDHYLCKETVIALKKFKASKEKFQTIRKELLK